MQNLNCNNVLFLHNCDFLLEDLKQNGVLLCFHLILQLSLVHLLHVLFCEAGLHIDPNPLLFG